MTPADDLAADLRSRFGVEEMRSRFGHEVAFRHGGMEFLHLHGTREADVRLGRERIAAERERLVAHPGVRLRETGSSDWVIVPLRSTEDVDFVRELVDELLGA